MLHRSSLGRRDSVEMVTRLRKQSTFADMRTPTELKLNEKPEFVQLCAERLRKSAIVRARCNMFSHALFDQLSATCDEPNWSLVMWANYVFPQAHLDADESRALPPDLRAALAGRRSSPPDAPGESEAPPLQMQMSADGIEEPPKWRYLVLAVALPLVQLFLMSYAFYFLLCPFGHGQCGERLQPKYERLQPKYNMSNDTNEVRVREFTVEDYCIVSEVADTPGEQVNMVAEFVCDCILFSIATISTSLASREWEAIGFLGSLRYNRVANSILYLASVFDGLCGVLFAFSLYLLIVDVPNVVDVLFNCMALQFVMELDNVLVKCFPRARRHARTALQKLCPAADAEESDWQIKIEHLVMFRASPPGFWSEFGWHRAHACVRCVMLYIHNFTKLVGFVVIIVAYVSLLFCHGIYDPTDGTVKLWG